MPFRSSARLVAPIALVAFALALLVVVTTSGGDGGGGAPSRPESRRKAASPKPRRRPARTGVTGTSTGPTTTGPTTNAAAYTVKPGDILSTIAERTGVSVERLQELNPHVDPHALVSGQRLKLKP